MRPYYKSRLNILCWLLLLVSTPALSQDIQLAGFSFTKFPGAEVKDSGLNQKLEVSEYNFFLNLPMRLKNDRTTLINGLEFRLVAPSVNNDPNKDLNGQHLYLIGYRLTAVYQLQHNWMGLVSLNPTLSSTLSTAIEKDDFLLNGTIQFIRKKSERFSYGGGLALTSRFGEPTLVPTLLLKFCSEYNQLRIRLPWDISYEHYFGKFTGGFQILAGGSRYNTNFTRINSRNDIEHVDRLTYTRVILGPTLSYRMSKAIQLEASGGFTIARRMEVQGDHFDDADYDVKDGPFFRIGIALIPFKKDNL